MLGVLQIKFLIAILVLLAGVSSYLAYAAHQRESEQRQIEQAGERMRTEAPKEMPSGWAKSLKDK